MGAPDMWDAIVIGSGISGLTAAAALAKRGRRVLVLEQHSVAGGLTQTFQRQHWNFATGVHYVSGVGPEAGPGGQFGRLLHWLTDGALQFASCGNPYDIVRLPGFEFGIEHPEAAFRQSLHARFPADRAAIERWFDEMEAARRSAFSMMAARGLPAWLAWGMHLWRGEEMRRYSERTLAEALAGIEARLLRAVLGARWGDYGAPPQTAPLLEHALVTGSYDHGAFYPVGGPGRFAQTMAPVIEGAGGEVRLGADVREIQLEQGRAAGAVCDHGGRRQAERARHIVSTMGVVNTMACLGPRSAPDWQQSVRELRPGLSYLALYLGFDGDIATAGASAANVWLYESEAIDRVWQAPADDDAPGLFVSFPSLKDPAHTGGHTAEVLALCEAKAFVPWLHLPANERPQEYVALKSWIEERMLAQFKRHFPTLAPMVRFHELSTPITQQRFVRTPDGAMYGMEMSARRLASPALQVRTPVPGLLLAGQDITGAGIQAASMSGLMAAAAVEPALLRQLGS
jgi:all-trans-retinol 13,14-reductase